MKIGNTSFNPEAIKEMSFVDFNAQYKGQLPISTKEAYLKITGKIPEANEVSESTPKVKAGKKK